MFEKKEKIELDGNSSKSFNTKTIPKETAKCHLGNGIKFKIYKNTNKTTNHEV